MEMGREWKNIYLGIEKKQNIQILPFDKNIKADIIYGFHKYMEGNTVIENSQLKIQVWA